MSGRKPLKFDAAGNLNPRWKPRKSGRKARKGEPGYKKRSGRSARKFDDARFIALDSEGRDTGRVIDGAREHISILWAASDGARLSERRGIDTERALHWLIERAVNNPGAVFVVFAGNYDANMLLRAIPRETALELWQNGAAKWTFWKRWAFKMIPRKYLEIARLSSDDAFLWNDRSGWKLNAAARIRIYDVFGFFQASFVKAVEDWLGKGWPDLELIREGKAARNDFSRKAMRYIERYTTAELKALVALMEKLRDSLGRVDLRISAWWGAGSIAAAMLKKNSVLDHYAELPADVELAARHAYFGGRIEIGKYGFHDAPVYHYDINSAYPDVQARLPALAGGRWIRRRKVKPESIGEFSLVRVRWHYEHPWDYFLPFPYRSEFERKVLYPHRGENWLWFPEIKAALDNLRAYGGRVELELMEALEFAPASDARPFAWLGDYYAERRALVEEAKRTGIPNGAEKVLKLGLNSLYGKTAQTVGGKGLRAPRYHCMAYAGFITSTTRARLYSAAMLNPGAIISLATDGVFSTAPLPLPLSKEKNLGAWGEERHEAMALAQAGFYWIRDKGEWREWSRGFDRIPPGPRYQAAMREHLGKVRSGWEAGDLETYFPCTRFITLGTALRGEDWWPRWCAWYSMGAEEGLPGRRLALTCAGTKRRHGPRTGRAHRSMVQTYPAFNLTPEKFSEAYRPDWLLDDDDAAASAECEDGQE